jgi:hypothetical protein
MRKDPDIPLPPADELGPAMLALKKDAHRVFAWHYANNGANATDAALAAGWGEGIAYQTGWRLKQRDDITAAIIELSDKNLVAGRAVAAKALLDMANNPDHKGHMKAVEALLEHSGGSKLKRKSDDLTDEQILARIVALATKYRFPIADVLGASAPLAQLPPPLELKADEIDPELAELF